MQGAGFTALTRILTLLAALVAAGASGVPADTAPARAESLYSRQQWTDAEAAFLACAARAPGTAAAAGAYVKAGLCRLKTRDEKGAFALFRQVADDPAAAKSAPDAAASAFDQSTFNSQRSTFKCMCGVKATRRDDCGGRFLRPGVDGGCRKTYVGAVFRSERESRSDVRKRVRLHGEHRRVGWVRRLHTAWRRLFLVCGRVPFCRSEFQLLRERLWDGGVSPGADATVKRANLRLTSRLFLLGVETGTERVHEEA